MALAILTTHIALSWGCSATRPGSLPSRFAARCPTTRRSGLPGLQLLSMFALMFGIPLSFLALLTGITLTLVTKWSLFRYPWPIAKLCLIISVILVGAFVLRPVLTGSIHAGDGQLIAGATYRLFSLGWCSVRDGPGRYPADTLISQ